MGINPFWQEDVFLTVQDIYHQAQLKQIGTNVIIQCNDHVFIHLQSIDTLLTPAQLIELQLSFKLKNQLLFHLWEDVWLAKRTQVLSRIKSFCGMNSSVHGRKATVTALSKTQTADFLNTNHLQGYVQAKYNYGLTVANELVAVASFSATRLMKTKGPTYQSAELVRFASKDGFTVVGGLSKLIKHFKKNVAINDLMTYADRDWSLGQGYEKLGFELSGIIPPLQLFVDKKTLMRYAKHRLPIAIQNEFSAQNNLTLDDFLAEHNYLKVFNTGNLKYHLYTPHA